MEIVPLGVIGHDVCIVTIIKIRPSEKISLSDTYIAKIGHKHEIIKF